MGRGIRNSDGLHIGEPVRNQCRATRRAPEIIFLAVLLYLETFLTLQCIITLTGVEIRSGLLAAGIFFTAVFMLSLHLLEGWGMAALAVIYLLFIGVFMWESRGQLRDGFFHLENSVIDLINQYYKIRLKHLQTEYDEAKTVTQVFLCAAQVLLFVYAQALLKNRLNYLALLLMLAAAFSGLAVGIVPQELFFAGMVVCIMGTVAMELVPESERKRWKALPNKEGRRLRSRAAAMSGGIMLLLFLMVSACISENLYREKFQKPELKAELQETYERISGSSFWEEIADYFTGKGKTADIRNQAEFTASSQGGISYGGVNGGHFSRSGSIQFDNVTALKVTLPELEQAVYLKGYNGAVYTKTGWQDLSNQQMKQYRSLRNLYSADAQDMQVTLMKMLRLGNLCLKGYSSDEALFYHGDMTVDYITAGRKYVYGPYFWNAQGMENLTYEQDSYILPSKRMGSYQFEFYMLNQKSWYLLNEAEISEFTGDEEWEKYLEFEAAYREFVQAVYTGVPAGHEELQVLGRSLAEEGDSAADKVEKVADFLSCYEYTLSPGEMPASADFVNYFLFENKKGYCVHFASSAVLLLRSMGVPARYAEGYLITASDINRGEAAGNSVLQRIMPDGSAVSKMVQDKIVEVRDYSAHAWIEVYFDVVGWIPIEMTTGYGGVSESGELPEDIREEMGNLPTPTPLPANTPLPDSQKQPISVPASIPTAEPAGILPTSIPEQSGNNEISGGSGELNGTPEENQKTEKELWFFKTWYETLPAAVKWILDVMLLIGIVLFGFGCRYRIVMYYRRNRKRNRKKQVIWYYRRMEKFLKEEKLHQGSDESYEAFAERVQAESAAAPENFADFQELALRAGFGRERISKEETEGIRRACIQMRNKLLEKGGRLRTIYLKFVKLY